MPLEKRQPRDADPDVAAGHQGHAPLALPTTRAAGVAIVAAAAAAVFIFATSHIHLRDVPGKGGERGAGRVTEDEKPQAQKVREMHHARNDQVLPSLGGVQQDKDGARDVKVVRVLEQLVAPASEHGGEGHKGEGEEGQETIRDDDAAGQGRAISHGALERHAHKMDGHRRHGQIRQLPMELDSPLEGNAAHTHPQRRFGHREVRHHQIG